MKQLLVFCSGFFFCAALLSYLFFARDAVFHTTHINFESTSGNFRFLCIPQKSRDANYMESEFVRFKSEHPEFSDDKLFRVTRKNYLKISLWPEYKLMKEWQYPLKS